MGDSLSPDIDGVRFVPRRIIEDARGAILHVLRSDDEAFTRFGEVYVSEVRSGFVKGWKRHSAQSQRIAVAAGSVRFVLCDDRDGSPTRGVTAECELGRNGSYGLLLIPPGVWYGFESTSNGVSLLVSCPDRPHDPAESETRDPGPEGLSALPV